MHAADWSKVTMFG